MNLQKEVIQKKFGEHIRDIRLKQGLTQVEVSSKMNKDQQSLQRVESGNVSPSLFYLFQLADGLGVTINQLMDFDIVNQKDK